MISLYDILEKAKLCKVKRSKVLNVEEMNRAQRGFRAGKILCRML